MFVLQFQNRNDLSAANLTILCKAALSVQPRCTFIFGHIGEPAGLCRAAGKSSQILEANFERCFSVTPALKAPVDHKAPQAVVFVRRRGIFLVDPIIAEHHKTDGRILRINTERQCGTARC